jgi:hypothetical protein
VATLGLSSIKSKFMKSPKLFLLTICTCLLVLNSFAQCTTGCTTTVSTTTTTNYTVAAGQQLCVTATGKITGNITLTGGTVCNMGTIQAPVFTVTNGIINNYGYILQLGNLELSGTSILNNYNFVEVEVKFLVNPTAKYLTQNAQAVLWVYRFSTTFTPNANANYAKLCRKIDGGTYLASDGFLYFKYDEEYVAGTCKYKIYDNNRGVVMSNGTDALPVKAYGDNRYALKVACKIPLGDYVLEVTNDKNEVSYLRFKVNVQQYCP